MRIAGDPMRRFSMAKVTPNVTGLSIDLDRAIDLADIIGEVA